MTDEIEAVDALMEDDPGIYQDLLAERDEAMERCEAAQRSAREMHIAADQFARERDELRVELETLQHAHADVLDALSLRTAEVERLKRDAREVCAPTIERQSKEIERLRQQNELLRAVAETSRTYVFGLVNTGSRYDAVVAALTALDACQT